MLFAAGRRAVHAMQIAACAHYDALERLAGDVLSDRIAAND
jgi:hypothetical protein